MTEEQLCRRIETLLPETNGKLRQKTFGQFNMDGHHYVVLAEYNPHVPKDGIYYGIECTDCQPDERKSLLEKWQKLNAIITDWIKAEPGIPDEIVHDNIYWVFWIRLDDDKAASLVVDNCNKILQILHEKSKSLKIEFAD